MGSVLSDIDFLNIADMRKNRESLMPFTVGLTGYRSIARCIELALPPTVSKYMLETAAFNNSRLKWNPFRYPGSCLSLRVSLMKRSRTLNDVMSLVGLFIVLLCKTVLPVNSMRQSTLALVPNSVTVFTKNTCIHSISSLFFAFIDVCFIDI